MGMGMCRKRRRFLLRIGVCAALFVLVLVLEMRTDLDLRVQDTFYDFTQGRWLVTSELHKVWGLVFYSGFKRVVAAFGVAAALVLIGSFFTSRPRSLRSPCLKIVLALALIPLTVSALKATTHVYCPASLERYGGSKPYVRICESYPEGQKPSGRCFPAGHASGGFAFLILAFCFRETWKRVLGALCGLALGWTAGWYQMMRGEHFLSHTLATMILAWALCLCINALVERVFAARSRCSAV